MIPGQSQQSTTQSTLWVEKYRPRTMNDVVGHELMTEYLTECIAKKNIPNLILHGEPGCGKTSTIMAMARDIYGGDYLRYVHEFNASDDRGITTVRNKLHVIAKQSPPSIGFKIIILDEADFLTNEAQAALRKVMEEYSNRTIFCLMCNYIHKIIKPIQSRCMTFYFKTVPLSAVKQSLNRICKIEQLSIPMTVIDSISSACRGDLRTGITMLQTQSLKEYGDASDTDCVFGLPTIDRKAINILEKLYTSIIYKDNKTCYIDAYITMLTEDGYSHISIIKWILNSVVKDSCIPERIKVSIIPIISRGCHNTMIGCNGHIQTISMCNTIYRMHI